MPTTIAEAVGPRPLLANLLLHQQADARTLSATLSRRDEQIQRSLHRLVRRGIVSRRDAHYEITPSRRPAVADYAEGAISLRELVQACR